MKTLQKNRILCEIAICLSLLVFLFGCLVQPGAPHNAQIIINGGDISTDSIEVVLSLTAEDDVAVTDYYISNTATTPDTDSNGWVSVSPSPTFSSEINYTIWEAGNKTVYAWFKDGDDNISSTSFDTIEIVGRVVIGEYAAVTSESGTAVSFSVSLNTRPDGEVWIDLASSDTTEGTVSPSSLAFDSENWDTGQTVTATGIDDDLADSNQLYEIQLSINTSATLDTTYYSLLNPLNLTFTNSDNDTPGFTITSISGDTIEDGTSATFTVGLNTQPDDDVVIDVSSSDNTEGDVSPDSLVYIDSNWNIPQTVTVTGVDDDLVDGDVAYSITLVLNSAGTLDTTGYADLEPDDVGVTNVDDDTIGYSINAVIDTILEGTPSFGQFDIKLLTIPSGDVVVDLSISDTSQGIVFMPMMPVLTFTTSDWNTEQTVLVQGVEDDIADGNQVFYLELTIDTVNTTDSTGYAALAQTDISITSIDDDTAGISVSAVSGDTEETGTTADFTVTLNTKPSGNVVIDVASSNTAEGTVSPSSLVFDDTDWNVPQTVTVTGVDDSIDDGDQLYDIQLTVNAGSTTDTTGYDSLTLSDISLTNIDNETLEVLVSAISGNTAENGTQATFDVSLGSQPDGSVAIDVVNTDTSEGSISDSLLTFTDSDWNTPQTVTVTGVNDDVDDGDQPFDIQLTINAGATTDTTGYASLDPDDVAVTNLDDDTAGILVGSTDLFTSEDASADAFTVVLNSEPTGDVVFDIINQDASEGSVSDSSLTFTSANWDTPQNVTVTGVNDSLYDKSQTYVIQINTDTTGTADSNYDVLDPDDVSVINVDNDWKLSDTGQTTSYTATFGEDHDYTINPPSFTDNTDGTITDNNTGLMWEQADSGSTSNWSDAATYCSGQTTAGYSDWRLPTIEELEGIPDYGVYNPALDPVFSITASFVFWSSTESASNTDNVWTVHFNGGLPDNSSPKTGAYYTRCVRDTL